MNANIILLVCALVLIVATGLYGHFKWRRLNAFDLHVLMAGIFFGGYTLVDALVKDMSMMDPFLIILVFSLITIQIATAWFLIKLIPATYIHYLQIRYLATQWSQVPGWITVLLLLLVTGFLVYSYEQFGIVKPIDNYWHLTSLWMSLPYWLTSTLSLIQLLTFCLSLVIASKAFTSSGRIRLFWLTALAIVLPLGALYGRRSLFLVMFVLLILWFLAKRRNLFSLRSVPLLSMIVVVLFSFSNLYQSYRDGLLSPTATGSTSVISNVSEAVTNVKATFSNLQLRQATWEFNYLILDKQEHTFGTLVPYGAIMWQAFKNSIPRVLWQEKVAYDLDETVAKLYNLPVTDYASNDFAFTQADFGYLSLFVLPLMLLTIIVSMALLVRATRNHPTLLLLLSGTFLDYLLNIEKNYVEFLTLYRNVALITVVYVALYAAISFPALLRPTTVLRRERRRLA